MTKRFPMILAACAALALAGCAGGGQQQEETPQAAAETMDQAAEQVADAAQEMAGEMQDAAAAVADLAPKEGETLLVGTLGCGHCNYQLGESCSAAMKTADGTVYIMEGIESGHVLFDDRKSEKPVQVVGTTTEKDGMHYVDVRAYNL